MEEYLHKDLTSVIIQAFYRVYNTLGYGFLEKVYENALKIELTKTGILCEQQKNIKVYYESEQVGDYYADLLVNGLVIIELKSSRKHLRRTRDSIIKLFKSNRYRSRITVKFW